jgi:hypothetical protein
MTTGYIAHYPTVYMLYHHGKGVLEKRGSISIIHVTDIICSTVVNIKLVSPLKSAYPTTGCQKVGIHR